MITTSTISMPSRITPQQYGQAVLEHVQTGAYPESEEVISAEFPPSALPEVVRLIEQAREDVKVCFDGRFQWLLRVVIDRDYRLLSGKLAGTARRILMAGFHKLSN